MDCRTNCPEVCKFAKSKEELTARLTDMRAASAQNADSLAQNRRTASLLAKLPSNRSTAEARSNLQQAVVEVSEAQKQVVNSIGLLNNAVELNETATDAIIEICPGGPVEIPDPNQPGRMILTCASPAVYSE